MSMYSCIDDFEHQKMIENDGNVVPLPLDSFHKAVMTKQITRLEHVSSSHIIRPLCEKLPELLSGFSL